ncbi:MAG TPA: hypothetical protein VFX48_05870, partial [Saprospiraceae bacterium]|nr:hypothetical protein [Saprospiraceae bacterium]
MNLKLKDFSVLLVIGITLLCILALGKVRFEFDLDRMVPTGNEDRMFYDQFRYDFQAEVDDHILLIGLECRDGLFQKSFLESLDRLTNALSGLDKVQKVFSLSNSPNLFFDGTEWQVRPVIHSLMPDRYREDSIRLYQSPEYRDLFLSRDRQSVSIAVFHANGMTANEKDQLTDSIKFHLNKWMPGRFHLAGKMLIERSYVREIIQNFKTFSG